VSRDEELCLSAIAVAPDPACGYNPPMIIYGITAVDHCRRVESLLQNLMPQAPLSYLKKLAGSGHVTVNNEATTPDSILMLDDTVGIKESGKTRAFLSASRPELDILYEDQWIIVFNKKSGLAVHRAAEVDDHNLVELGRRVLAKRGIEGKLRPVNRLDRGTSGVIIMAKSPTAAGMFGRMVKEEGLGKLYLAVTVGRMAEEGTITAPLDGKESETRYKLLFRGDGESLVAAYPVTGRMHQIRRHLKLAGHPVLGDLRYGGPPTPGLPGTALHSFRTVLTHPATGKALEIYAPLPQQLLDLLARLSGDFLTPLLRSLPELP
jgi:RluA family pseudouridine synthase